MPPAKNSKSKDSRNGVIQAITTPLGFYVLALLIVEATLGIVLVCSRLDPDKVWYGFLCIIGIFIGVIVVVTLFAWRNPRHLLYGKEEHSNPALDASALRDAIEEIIVENIKPDCLKNSQN